MDLKTALGNMKKARGEAMHFFFCEAGEDGKPVLLVEKQPIKSPEQNAILKKAKKKEKCHGAMVINADGELDVTPEGSVPSGLAKGLQIAARNGNAMVFSGINIKPPTPEQKPTGPEHPPGDQPKMEETKPTKVDPPKPGGQYAPKQGDPYAPYNPQQGTIFEKKPYASYTDSSNANPYAPVVPGDVSDISSSDVSDESETSAERAERERAQREREGEAERKRLRETESAKLGEMKTNAQKAVNELLHTEPFATAAKKLKQVQEAMEKAQKTLKRTDPVMVKLVEKHAEAEKELDDLMANEPAVKELSKIEEAIAKAQEILNKKGVVPKQMGADYQGEETRDREHTKYLSEEERKSRELKVGADGKVRDAHGNLVDGTSEYVMGTENKNLHRFEEHGKEYDAQKGQDGHLRHSSIMAGGEVAGAGGITFENGKITSISNKSGHYRPTATQLIQTVEELLRQGALLDKSWMITRDGKGVPLDGPALQLYDKAMTIQGDLETHAKTARDEQGKIDEKLKIVESFHAAGRATDSRCQIAEFDLQELLPKKFALDESMKKALAGVQKSMEMLGKLGAGPSNKIRDVNVEHAHIKQDMSGAQIKEGGGRNVQTDTSKAAEFLASGGGKYTTTATNKDGTKEDRVVDQAQQKGSMHNELKAKLKGKKETLDNLAEMRGKKVKSYLKSYFKKLESDVLPKLQKELKELVDKKDDKDKKAIEELQGRIAGYEKLLANRNLSGADLEKQLAELEKIEEMLPYINREQDESSDESSDYSDEDEDAGAGAGAGASVVGRRFDSEGRQIDDEGYRLDYSGNRILDDDGKPIKGR